MSVCSNPSHLERGGPLNAAVSDNESSPGFFALCEQVHQFLILLFQPSASRIFSTQGSNPGLPRCRRILYRLSHQVIPQLLGFFPFLPMEVKEVTQCMQGGTISSGLSGFTYYSLAVYLPTSLYPTRPLLYIYIYLKKYIYIYIKFIWLHRVFLTATRGI